MSENVVEETKPNENRETAKVTPLDNNKSLNLYLTHRTVSASRKNKYCS